MRQSGFYWIKFDKEDNWEPASWREEFQDFLTIGSDSGWEEKELFAVGEAIWEPPA